MRPTLSRPRPAGPLLVFCDTETDGLRRSHMKGGRRAWEVAACRREPDGTERWLHGFVRLADLPWDPSDPHLDRSGLDIGRFHDRHPEVNPAAKGEVYTEADMARLLWEFFQPMPGTSGMRAKPTLVGAVPSFEDITLADLLNRHGYIDSEGPWHYRLICAETAAAARLRVAPPWNSKTLSRYIGVDPRAYKAHEAHEDVQWAMDLYDMAHAPLWRILAARARVRWPLLLNVLRGKEITP